MIGRSGQEGRPAIAEREIARREMVERSISARGISERRVLEAMREVPRHLFVPESLQSEAYADSALPIGFGATISQPYIVALMTELAELAPGDTVLEIGTGSGYQAAVLSRLASRIFSIERIAELAERANSLLGRLGIDNVAVKVFDGSWGWSEQGPFDAILVTAAAPSVPEPLCRQLRDGGRLVIPVGNREVQELLRIRRAGERFVTESHGGVVFVPLVGRFGWPKPEGGPGSREGER
jgi:protein-L-isoaspartate(D-aspartate) O-methyltransferase